MKKFLTTSYPPTAQLLNDTLVCQMLSGVNNNIGVSTDVCANLLNGVAYLQMRVLALALLISPLCYLLETFSVPLNVKMICCNTKGDKFLSVSVN